MADRIANQHGLPCVPSDGQTYRTWRERQVAQVVDQELRSGCTRKRQAGWQVPCQQLVLFLMLGTTPGLQFIKLGKKEQRIGLYLLGYAGESGEFWTQACIWEICTLWINSLASTCLFIVWEKIEKWSWCTVQLAFYQNNRARQPSESAKYSRCFTCQRCDTSFPKAHCLRQHEHSCKAKVKRVYPGRVYHLSKTIFEKIEEEGIFVPPELKYSQYRSTFDIEVYYPGDGTNLPKKWEKL